MNRSYFSASKILSRTFQAVKNEHSSEGHAFITTHWQRYIHLLMRMPRITAASNVLEVGASILSNAIKSTYNATVETVFHELEPEWRDRFDRAGIVSHPAELLRDPLPVPDNSYDLILFDEVLEHFPVAPGFFLQQLIAKLKPDGELMLSVPNFATSEKRLQLLIGKNPQDQMDKRFVYYAHHREPVMEECIDIITECGGSVTAFEWSDFDSAPGLLESVWHIGRCLKHRMYHRVLHQLVPSMRAYLFLRIKRDPSRNNGKGMPPPLATTREFIR